MTTGFPDFPGTPVVIFLFELQTIVKATADSPNAVTADAVINNGILQHRVHGDYIFWPDEGLFVDQLQTSQGDELVFDDLEDALKACYSKYAFCRGGHIAENKLTLVIHKHFAQLQELR